MQFVENMKKANFSGYKLLIFILFYLYSALVLAIPGMAVAGTSSNFNQKHFAEINVENSGSSFQHPGNNNENVRIEYEIKLRLPLEQTDDVWDWLFQRYSNVSWLNGEGYLFAAEFGDEDFTDTYFDTPDLTILSENNGVRHRMRTVHSGPAIEKDDRQLIQVKLDRGDVTGVARSEIKFNVSSGEDRKGADESHALVGLVKRNERGEFKTLFYTSHIDPYQLKPLLTLSQNRRRIYLSDQKGAFATLTLDLVSTRSWGTHIKWAELELELNEIRYTEANDEVRERMERVIEKIQHDIQQAFSAIEPNQTPKYNTAFKSIEESTRIPVREVFRRGISADSFFIISIIFTLILIAGIIYFVRLLWLRFFGKKSVS